MIKTALFDVDKTIVKGDTMFMLLRYTLVRKPWSILRLPALMLNMCLYSMGFIDTTRAKESIFYVLKYLDESDLEHFFNTAIVDRIYDSARSKIDELKNNGYKIILVSASPECYLKYFKQHFDIDGVIGTRLRLVDGVSIPKITGRNCKGPEKVSRINSFLSEKDWEIDYKHSVAYSDSYSDKPMLDMVQTGFLVNNKYYAKYNSLKWR